MQQVIFKEKMSLKSRVDELLTADPELMNSFG